MDKLSNVRLVSFKWEHVSRTFKWVKDPDFQRLFMVRKEITWEGHQKYFRNILADSNQRVYAILNNNRHLGNCGLKNILLSKKEGELWIYIGEVSFRGKGIGCKAVELLLCEGFERLDLESIYIHVADFNTVARRFYRKLGFVETTLSKKDAKEWTNRGCNVIRMELKKDEWL